jgi:hypothetical protein
MSIESAGNMLQGAFKSLLGTVLKIAALVIAWFFEIFGKIFIWISEQIKRNAK